MKNRKYQKGNGSTEKMFADSSSEGRAEEVIGTKVLYNWLYQQEEEDYYLSANVSGSLPDFSQQEALFVEY